MHPNHNRGVTIAEQIFCAGSDALAEVIVQPCYVICVCFLEYNVVVQGSLLLPFIIMQVILNQVKIWYLFMFKALFQLDWGFASLERKRFLCDEGVQVWSVSFDQDHVASVIVKC